MPEIAEARTIANKIKNIKFIKSYKLSPNFFKHLNKNNTITKNNLLDLEIKNITTYGKSIIFELIKNDDKYILVSQLGMSGSWFNDLSYIKNPKNIHMTLSSGESSIYYYDPRMFGKFQLFKNKTLEEVVEKYNWGIDVLKASSLEIKSVLIKNREKKQTLKKFLLNQSYLSGIGNYLTSEIPFDAQIKPGRLLSSLSDQELKILSKSIKKVVSRALKHEGFSFAGGYFHPNGSLGNYSEHSLVYMRTNCPVCKNKLTSENIEGRITYYCHKCQK